MSAEAPVNIRSDSEEDPEQVGAGSQSSIGDMPKVDVKKGYRECPFCLEYCHWKKKCCSAGSAAAAARAADEAKTAPTQAKNKDTAFSGFGLSSTVTGNGEGKKLQCNFCGKMFACSHGLAIHRGRMQCGLEISALDEGTGAGSKSSTNFTYPCKWGCGKNLLSEPDRIQHHNVCYKNVERAKYHDDTLMSADLSQLNGKELASRVFPDAQPVAAGSHVDVSSYKTTVKERDMAQARKERRAELNTRLRLTLEELWELQAEGMIDHLPRMKKEQESQVSSQSLQDRHARQSDYVERSVQVVKKLQEQFAGDAFDALLEQDFSSLQRGSKMRRT